MARYELLPYNETRVLKHLYLDALEELVYERQKSKVLLETVKQLRADLAATTRRKR